MRAREGSQLVGSCVGSLSPCASAILNRSSRTTFCDESRVLYVRDVRTRVSKLVPFLKWDSNPYPILVNGRVKFVVDGYTTSDSYPYAESAQTDDLIGLRHSGRVRSTTCAIPRRR